MSVEIKEVTNNKELKQFVKFNLELYKGNPYHVPSLISEEMMTLDRKRNPAFEVCDAIYFLAYKNGKIAGRIAGIINRPSNEVWKQKRARARNLVRGTSEGWQPESSWEGRGLSLL